MVIKRADSHGKIKRAPEGHHYFNDALVVLGKSKKKKNTGTKSRAKNNQLKAHVIHVY